MRPSPDSLIKFSCVSRAGEAGWNHRSPQHSSVSALEPSSYTLITELVRPRFSPKWPFRDARLEVLVLKPGFTLNRPSHTSVHEDASPQRRNEDHGPCGQKRGGTGVMRTSLQIGTDCEARSALNVASDRSVRSDALCSVSWLLVTI